MDDICIIVENTQSRKNPGLPNYVTDVIGALPELSFAVVYITPKSVPADSLAAAYPQNLNTLVNVCTDNPEIHTAPTPFKKYARYTWEDISRFYTAPLEEKSQYVEKIIDSLAIDEKRVLNMKDIFFSKELWELIIADYKKKELQIPFLNYFKIFHLTQLPLFKIMDAAVPPAKVYHAFSGLYSNWLGVVAKKKYTSTLLIDERNNESVYGYFSNDRIIHLSLEPQSLQVLHDLHAATMNMVKYLSYRFSDILVTKHTEPQTDETGDFQKILPKTVQIQEGIEPASGIRHNGRSSQKPRRFLVGLVGSLVPGDDIKTFIRACSMIAADMDNTVFKIYAVPPIDEEYLLECISLRNNLNLAFKLEFVTEAQETLLPADTDVLVSTSLHNRNYRVLMEAMHRGIPLVCTGRGDTPELIHGDGKEDSALGECGFLTGIGNPEQVALAVMEILKDKKLRKAMGRTGKKRIETYYQKEANLKKYARLYEDFL